MDASWQDARDWLKASGCLGADSPACRPSSLLIDLVAAIQDGVVLCKVMNAIKPGSVLHFLPKPARQFQCFQNINSFLSACAEFLHVSVEDLFSSDELFNASKFQLVVGTLSRLSQTKEALALGLRSFPDKGKKTAPIEEDIYDNLEAMMAKQGNLAKKLNSRASFKPTAAKKSARKKNESNDSDSSSDEDEDLLDYEDYESVFEEKEDIYETVCAQRRQTKSAPTPTNKEEFIRMELIETEKNYVGVLKIIMEGFRQPMQIQIQGGGMGGLLTESVMETLFINIPLLYDVHKRFLAALEKTPDVSGVFLEFKNELLAYAQYCSRVPLAVKKYEEMDQRKEFSAYMNILQKNTGQRFPLKDLLSVPQQRMLKYPLLLRELNEKTTSKSAKQGLSAALKAMQDIAKYVNEAKRDQDNLQIIAEVQNDFKDYLPGTHGPPLVEYGKYLLDGDVRIRLEGDPKNTNKRYVFLFQKALVITKQKGSAYSFAYAMILRDFTVEEEWMKGKNIAIKMKSTLPSAIAFNCSLVCKSPESKDEWLDALKQAKLESSPDLSMVVNNTKHRYALTTFADAAYCDVCGFLLWGLVNQGFMCETCHSRCHYACLKKITSQCDGGTRRPSIMLRAGGGVVGATKKPPVMSDDDDPSRFMTLSGRINKRKIGSTADLFPQIPEQTPAPTAPNPVPQQGPPQGPPMVRNTQGSLRESPMTRNTQGSLRAHPGQRTPSSSSLESADGSKAPSPGDVAMARATGNLVVAIHNFVDNKSKKEGDLTFAKGEELIVLERSSEHWWKGRTMKGDVGVFPASFVALLGSLPPQSPAKDAPLYVNHGVTLSSPSQENPYVNHSATHVANAPKENEYVNRDVGMRSQTLPKNFNMNKIQASEGGMYGIKNPPPSNTDAQQSRRSSSASDQQQSATLGRKQGLNYEHSDVFLQQPPKQPIPSDSESDEEDPKHNYQNDWIDHIPQRDEKKKSPVKLITMNESPYEQSSESNDYEDPFSDQWFIGVLSREEAEQQLLKASVPNGGFFVRESTSRPGEYTLSLRIAEIVKHIKISSERGHFFLGKKMLFNSIPELITYYTENSLAAQFSAITTKLTAPLGNQSFKLRTILVALFPFDAQSPDELSFKKNDEIELLDKEGCGEGWWKGKLGSKIGVFPSSYATLRD